MKPGWWRRRPACLPPSVPEVLAVWKRHADLAGAEVEAERLHALRVLHLSPDWSGMTRLSGLLDPESGGVVLAAIRGLAEPAALDPQDTRTPAQRQADALVEISRRYLDGNPGAGSSRPHLQITIPWEALTDRHRGGGHRNRAHQRRRRSAVWPVMPPSAPSSWTTTACRWRPGRPAGAFPPPYAGPWTCGTSTAPIRDVTCPPAGATPITSSTGPTAAKPTWPTCACSAEPTTAGEHDHQPYPRRQ